MVHLIPISQIAPVKSAITTVFNPTKEGIDMGRTVDFTAEHYQQLAGKTVSHVVIDKESGFYGLKFTDGTIAWISRDEEGNGPGFLDIT